MNRRKKKRNLLQIIFSFEPPTDTCLKKLKVELTLQYYEPMEWKVKVLVYDRDREDNERGKDE